MFNRTGQVDVHTMINQDGTAHCCMCEDRGGCQSEADLLYIWHKDKVIWFSSQSYQLQMRCLLS
jgi:hypothetical protein